MITSIKKTLDLILEWLLVGVLGLLTLSVIYQVGARYLFNNPSSITEELARYLLIWLGLLGAAYASGKGMHLSIDLLSTKLSEQGQVWLNGVIQLLIMGFALATMVIGGLKLVNITLTTGQTSAALGIPLGYVYIALPLSGGLIMLYALMELLPNPKEA
ncbi:MAG: TRAP transporter small permease [Bacteroidota bacterium]